MRANTLSIAAALAVVAIAQDLSGLPSCAQSAALSAAGTSGCSPPSAECLCQNSGFISSLSGAITTTCTSAADQQAACAWGNSACSVYDVSIPCTSTPADPAQPNTDAQAPAVDAGAAAPSEPSTPASAAMDPAAASQMSTTGTMGGMTMTDASGSMTTMAAGMDGMTSTMMTMTHSSDMMSGNSTMMHSSHSGNMTHSMSKTASGPTSQYTGAANKGVRNSGVVGAAVGLAALFAFA